MLLLSSYERIKRFICVEDNAANKRVINQYLQAVSRNIQSYLGREFSLESRSEYFNINAKETEFWVPGIPVTSITSVEHDSEGLFDGNEQSLTDYHVGRGNNSVVIDQPETPGKRALKIVYTGGVATTSTKSTLATTGHSGTFLVDKFVTGGTSGAVGIITATTAATPIIANTLYGIFESGEALTMQSTEGGADVSGVGATISSITTQSFSEIMPDITLACDMQIAFNIRVKDNFELTGLEKDKSTRRDIGQIRFNGAYLDLQPEVRSLLNKYKKIWL